MLAVTLQRNVTRVLDEDSGNNSAQDVVQSWKTSRGPQSNVTVPFTFIHLFDVFFSASGGYENTPVAEGQYYSFFFFFIFLICGCQVFESQTLLARAANFLGGSAPAPRRR